MDKIIIIGPPGAGKTEFANEIGQILNINSVYHLDFYFWKPGWVRTTKEERLKILGNLTQKKRWIIEGNFLNTIDYQFSRADCVIWLNLNSLLCLFRVISRYLSYIVRETPEIAPGCKDKISLKFLLSIFTYKVVDSHIIRDKLREPNSPELVILNKPYDVNKYLERLRERF